MPIKPTDKQVFKIIREELKNILLEQAPGPKFKASKLADIGSDERTATGSRPRGPHKVNIQQILDSGLKPGWDRLYTKFATRKELEALQAIKKIFGPAHGAVYPPDQTTLDVEAGAKSEFGRIEQEAKDTDPTTLDCTRLRKVFPQLHKLGIPESVTDPKLSTFLTGIKGINLPPVTVKSKAHVSSTADEAYKRLVSKYNFLDPASLLKICKTHAAYGGQGVDRESFLVNVGETYLLAKKEDSPLVGSTPLMNLIADMRAGLDNMDGTDDSANKKSDPIEVYNLFYLEFFVGMGVRWGVDMFSVLPHSEVVQISPSLQMIKSMATKSFKSDGMTPDAQKRAAQALPHPYEVQIGSGKSVPVFRTKWDSTGDNLPPFSVVATTETCTQTGDRECRSKLSDATARCIAGICHIVKPNMKTFRVGVDNTPELEAIVKELQSIASGRPDENKFKILPAKDETILSQIEDPRDTITGARADFDQLDLDQKVDQYGFTSGVGVKQYGTNQTNTLTGRPQRGRHSWGGKTYDSTQEEGTTPWYRRVSDQFYKD